MIIVENIVQGSPEWIQEKLGKPSASNISRILTSDGKPSKQREGYLYELAAEIVTGEREETYSNENMTEMGNGREDESANYYAMVKDVELQKVGVVYMDKKKQWLCSPDRLVNKKYGLELKNVLGKTQIKRLLEGSLPSEYFGQIQMSLFITGFDRWDFMSYRPKMKPLIIEVGRDEKYIKALASELELFIEELNNVVERIK